MIAHRRTQSWSTLHIVMKLLGVQLLSVCQPARAINIVVDYRYDTNIFFNTQQKRDTLEAAAERFSAIITTSLSASSLSNNSTDPRIGFTHPGLGTSFQVSPATSSANDALVASGGAAANEYRGPWSIDQDAWILYAGGRPLSVLGQGGTGTGLNFTTVFSDGSSHLNRGFRETGSDNNLPVWGGAITFDNDGSTTWHFDPDTTPPAGSSDLYGTALHEIGHALGLSGSWIEWTNRVSGGQFSGPAAVAAYNDDNGTSLAALNEVGGSNHHWQDGTYESFIFNNEGPKYAGTVGPAVLQDLLMEPTANLTPTVRRFERTNVDVAALVDVGWDVVPQLMPLFGDYNDDGAVDAADYVVWRKNFGTTNVLPNDPDGGTIGSLQYDTWQANFGQLSGSGSHNLLVAVPEPTSAFLCAVSALAWLGIRRGWCY